MLENPTVEWLCASLFVFVPTQLQQISWDCFFSSKADTKNWIKLVPNKNKIKIKIL